MPQVLIDEIQLQKMNDSQEQQCSHAGEDYTFRKYSQFRMYSEDENNLKNRAYLVYFNGTILI